eukprot:TRINITY_DN77189_c0_g1_i1.p1 TRINITY_DN77189_c0_g1~~TRINITY_DN77189_c0_g1_i1.p1  ORF type:complete len:263 (-),score=56.81 TRINITY_DN77189_c0_g1_i1:175-963(-)
MTSKMSQKRGRPLSESDTAIEECSEAGGFQRQSRQSETQTAPENTSCPNRACPATREVFQEHKPTLPTMESTPDTQMLEQDEESDMAPASDPISSFGLSDPISSFGSFSSLAPSPFRSHGDCMVGEGTTAKRLETKKDSAQPVEVHEAGDDAGGNDHPEDDDADMTENAYEAHEYDKYGKDEDDSEYVVPGSLAEDLEMLEEWGKEPLRAFRTGPGRVIRHHCLGKVFDPTGLGMADDADIYQVLGLGVATQPDEADSQVVA